MPITIIIGRKPPKPLRTRDKAPDLAALYLDLYERLLSALEEAKGTTHDDFNPEDHPHAPAGQSNGGQFVSKGGPTGPKPTSTVAKVAKHAIHELLSSGHPFSVSELKAITGHENEKTLTSWIAMFKSEKYAGAKGALNIKKLPNGSYQVVMPDGTPAPPAPAGLKLEDVEKPVKVEPNVIKHEAKPYTPKVTVPFAPVSKEKADKSYAFQLETATDEVINNIEDGMDPTKAVLKFKNAKLLAMAQWKTNTTGTLYEPKLETKLYEADKILAQDLTALTQSDDLESNPNAVMAKWKHNTQLEKQGKLGAPAQPKPETKELGKALAHWTDVVKDEPPPPPKPYEHLIPKGFRHIAESDFTSTGKKAFGYQITALKRELAERGAADAVGNKKSVESSLQEALKDKKHYQALRSQYKACNPAATNSLERRLVENWASSSGDSNNLACAIQLATQDAFSQPKDAVTYQQLHSVSAAGDHDKLLKIAASSLNMELKTAAEVKAFRQGLQEFVHGQYENTQKMLKEMGRDHIMVARGMKHSPGSEHFSHKPANVKLQPASSFSANYGTASSFAGSSGTVYLCKIPASQVLGTYLTGFGCTSEHEVVVLGHDTIKSFPVKKSEASTLLTAIEQIQSRIETAEMKK